METGDYKELFPVVVASYVWVSQWFWCHVLFRLDNQVVVRILLSSTSKVPCIMRLLCLLLSAAAHFNFTFTSQYIPGIHNNIADALSHFHWQVSGIWPPGHSPTLSQSLVSFGSSWSLLFRGAVPQLSGARVGSVYARLLSVWPEEIFWILHSAWQNSPVPLPLHCRWVVIVPVCNLLTSSVQHSTIKVYLSAVRALHIEQGISDPVADCLQLQRILRGIKRTRSFIFTFTHYRWHHDGNFRALD